MRALAALIVKGPVQAALVIALCTVLSFVAPPLTSLAAYAGAAALALYVLHRGVAASVPVVAGALLVTGLLGQLLSQQGTAAAIASALLWLPVWVAAGVLAATRSLAMAMLVLAALAMLAVALIFVILGDPAAWWQMQLQRVADALSAAPQLDAEQLNMFVQEAAPVMTGSIAAGLEFAVLSCLVLGRWWQSLLVKPGAWRGEFYALRLNGALSLAGVGIVALATLNLGVVSDLALQWSLIAMVLFLFVGLAVMHATLANLKAARGWIVAAYVLIGLLPQALLMVVATGLLDPWVDLRRRTAAT